jgi:uncharacterized protein YjiS (DUF1127 family)
MFLQAPRHIAVRSKTQETMEMIMSSFSRAAASHAGSRTGILPILAAATARWWEGYRNWRQRRAAIAHLRSLSDRHLADIGISRSEIEFAVLLGRERDHTLSRYF